MNVRRHLFPTLALGAALTATAAAPAVAHSGVVHAGGRLVDLQPAQTDPTDGARAQLVVMPGGGGGSRAVLVVSGLDAEPGRTFGAHAHTGPCVAGQPATAGPHYNTEPGGLPADRDHELWLDFVVRPGGVGVSSASVPFVIPEGDAQAVVIHQLATAPGGGAGPRLACLPVDF